MRNPEKGQDLSRRFTEWVDERGCSSFLEIITPEALDTTLFSSVDIVVNCTPVGMHPETNATPLSLLQVEALNPDAHVVDLIYNPQESSLMKLAQAHGCPVVQNGLGMLIHQAIEAFCTWTKLPAEDTWYDEVEARLLRHLETL